MTEDIKYIICPHCGALLEKGVTFCGYCGKNINEKDMSFLKSQEEEEKKAVKVYGKPPTKYQDQPELLLTRPTDKDSKHSQGEIQKFALAEAKIRNASIYSWLSMCLGLSFGIVGTIVAIIAIVNCVQAKKLVGYDPRITQYMSLAIAGAIAGVAVTLVYVFVIFRDVLF